MNKNYRFILILAILILPALAGCNKIVHHPDNVTDIDGNVYKIVTIAGQTWMAENLRVTRYRNGTPIPGVPSNTDWSRAYSPFMCDYEYHADSANGKLYNYHAIEPYKDHYLAPKGWRIPTKHDWEVLIEALGGGYGGGGRLKAPGKWADDDTYPWMLVGFNAIPSGQRDYSARFLELGESAYYWAAERDPKAYWSVTGVSITNSSRQIMIIGAYEKHGFSVRCIRED